MQYYVIHVASNVDKNIILFKWVYCTKYIKFHPETFKFQEELRNFILLKDSSALIMNKCSKKW